MVLVKGVKVVRYLLRIGDLVSYNPVLTGREQLQLENVKLAPTTQGQLMQTTQNAHLMSAQ